MPDTRQHFFYFFTIFLSHVIIRSQFPITRTMTNGRTIWASMQGGWPSATLSKRVVCLQRLTELAPPFDSANPAKLSAIAETGWVRTGCRKEETAKGRNGDAEHVVYSPIPGSGSRYGVGRGCGVGRSLGNGVGLSVAVGVGVGVGVTAGVGLGVTAGVGVGVTVGVAVGVG